MLKITTWKFHKVDREDNIIEEQFYKETKWFKIKWFCQIHEYRCEKDGSNVKPAKFSYTENERTRSMVVLLTQKIHKTDKDNNIVEEQFTRLYKLFGIKLRKRTHSYASQHDRRNTSGFIQSSTLQKQDS